MQTEDCFYLSSTYFATIILYYPILFLYIYYKRDRLGIISPVIIQISDQRSWNLATPRSLTVREAVACHSRESCLRCLLNCLITILLRWKRNRGNFCFYQFQNTDIIFAVDYKVKYIKIDLVNKEPLLLNYFKVKIISSLRNHAFKKH